MNLFRSEGHVAIYNATRGYEPGATITAATMSELAHAWWGTRLEPTWQPRTPAESQAILEGLGLSGPFWQLT
jgi:hypothetical protein